MHFSVIIMGGGINGAGCARELALRNVSCALFEKGDFASGTSSASSKLVHGGLRYLEQFQFGLVRESLHERKRLLKNAPHLVKPLPFLLPIYIDSPVGKWKMRLGLTFYDLFSWGDGMPRHKWLSKAECAKIAPELRQEGLIGAFRYYDAQMDDARLCLECILQAQSWGASVHNYTEIVRADEQEGKRVVHVRDVITGEFAEHTCDVLVNTAGCWTDEFFTKNPPLLRPSKGVHLVLDEPAKPQAFLLRASDKRVFFSMPWQGKTLIGTTDTEYSGAPDKVEVEPSDIAYLQQSLRRTFPGSTDRILATFAGLRPLLNSTGSTYKLSREEIVLQEGATLVSLLGGKYTTFRAMTERLCKVLHNMLALPGTFKSLSRDLPLHSPLPFPVNAPLAEQVDFAIKHEMARTPEDFLRRRTSLALTGDGKYDNEVRALFSK